MKPKKAPPQPDLAPIAPPGDDSDMLDELTETLRSTLATVSTAIKHSKGSDAGLVKQAVGLVTELRKVDAAKRKRLEALSLPQVMTFLRNLDAEDQSRVIRELQAMSRRGGVLG